MALNIPDNPISSGDGKANPYGFYQFNGSYTGTSTIIAAGTYTVSVIEGRPHGQRYSDRERQ